MQLHLEALHVRNDIAADLDAWRRWAASGELVADATPPTCAVPPMLRRRLTPLGRLALGALAQLAPREAEPMIFASSWGDISRSFAMLETLIADNEVSPMQFSASVHNGIGAVASIWQKNTTAYKAVCAQRFTTEAALTEAFLMLAGGHDSVLIVRYDDAMPEPWRETSLRDTPERAYAWAVRVTKEPTADTLMTLTLEPAVSDRPRAMEPMRELAFLLSDQTHLLRGDGEQAWQWSKR